MNYRVSIIGNRKEKEGMVLSKRLYMVASFVTPGYRLADVGCDHAYTSIYLVRHGIIPKAIAMDINEGPLERASLNIEAYGYKELIETRLSNGLEKLNNLEADTILIAGMGGELMVKILTDGMEKVLNVKELVLQPQSEPSLVRHFLHDIGFQIIDEDICIDDGKFYTVIHAVNLSSQGLDPTERESYERDCFYRFGKVLLTKKHPVLKEYLKDQYKKAMIIQNSLESNQTENTKERLPEFMKELEVLEDALTFFSI